MLDDDDTIPPHRMVAAMSRHPRRADPRQASLALRHPVAVLIERLAEPITLQYEIALCAGPGCLTEREHVRTVQGELHGDWACTMCGRRP